jgi:hypothetical protein
VPVIGSIPVVAAPTPVPTPVATPKPTARITTRSGARKLDSKRRVTLATVGCPAGATCSVTAPKTVKVTIKSKRFTVTVVAAETLAGGRSMNVGLQLSKSAAKRLKGRTAKVTLKLSARAGTTTPTTMTVQATITGAKR